MAHWQQNNIEERMEILEIVSAEKNLHLIAQSYNEVRKKMSRSLR